MAYVQEMGDNVTLSELERAVNNGFSPIVEIWSMDGVYVVRLHHHVDKVSSLCDKDGQVLSFKGTGKICDMLGEIGLTHGVLTLADQNGDEMIGVASQPVTRDEMLAYGTRIAFR